MLNKNFKDYKEFKELYVREDGKAKNHILLAFTRSKEMYEWYKDRCELDRFYGINSMPRLYDELVRMLQMFKDSGNTIEIGDFFVMSSPIYGMDVQKGLCFDGDIASYRYIRNGKPYKMKVGRMVRHLIDACSLYGAILPETCKLWLCEEIAAKWQTYAKGKTSDLTLVVDDDFEYIYQTENYKNEHSMGSCMEDDNNFYFYNEAVDASAASLRDCNGKVLARCVIYNNATQIETGKKFRLAERQYSIGGTELYKRILVAKLVEAGLCDAYKTVGASCHEPKAWVDVTGQALEHTQFSLPCRLQHEDTISYQDSFKWYDEDKQVAYNFNKGGNLINSLETTDSMYRSEKYYSSWDDDYSDEPVVECFCEGRRYTIAPYNTEYHFRWVDGLGQYHHEDDVRYCECCDVWVLSEDALTSELVDGYFCCEECLEEAEEQYRKENPEEE